MARLPPATAPGPVPASPAYEVHTRPFSTPDATTTTGRPSSKSEDLPRQQQEFINELGDQLWEFDADTTIRILSPKVFPSDSCQDPYPPLQSFDFLVDVTSVREIMDSMPEPGAINFMSTERFNHLPLSVFLNECAANCDTAYRKLVSAGVTFRGSLIQPINKRWLPMCRFHVYDKQTNSKDDVPNAAALKPDLAGVASTTSAKLTYYWSLPTQPPKPPKYARENAREILIPVEVKGNWDAIVGQAGTYARAQVNAVPLRLFSIVIGVNHQSHSLRFLIYHRGGLTPSRELNLDDPNGRRDVQRIMFSILLWQTPEDAGFPSFTNGIKTLIPSTDPAQPICVFTDRVLFHSLSVCGRGTLVFRVVRSRSQAETEGSLVPLRQTRSVTRALAVSFKAASDASPLTEGATPRPSANAETSPAHIRRRYHDKDLQGVHTLVPASLPSQSPTKFVLKFSWPNSEKHGLEPAVYDVCSGKFGVPEHLLSFDVCWSNGAACSNSLFLSPKGSTTFAQHRWQHYDSSESRNPPDYRTLVATATADEGRTLEHCQNALELAEGALHGQLGWLSMLNVGGASGFLHRDVSIGNVLWLDTPVERSEFSTRKGVAELVDRTTEIAAEGLASLQSDRASAQDDGTSEERRAEQLAQQDPGFWTNLRGHDAVKQNDYLKKVVSAAERLEKALSKLGVSRQCKALLIDGDMAAFLPKYFSQPVGVISGTPQFMSDALREAAQSGQSYVHGPVDDLQSWMWTTLWATVFNDAASEGISADISLALHRLQTRLASPVSCERHNVLNTIAKGKGGYTHMVSDMSPLFRKWRSALETLEVKFDKAWAVPGLQSPDKLLIFYEFALQGVADYAELLYDLKQEEWAGLVARGM